ncbi:Crp/Fnr family transcriptional regulator [Paracoccus ravus]|uniref:Crp/Fnr family transcriptional regulator n=1 Tax=Paracoccus ravus TaxID=2447760 RepID=UPI00106E9768|nr:Crp/Fnr family transcriptional regulator [Paracoccus ravus]
MDGILRHQLDNGLLQGISEPQRQAFLADCPSRSFPDAKDILQQGLSTEIFFIIAEGQVEVSYLDPEGNSIVVHIASPGEVLGEVEALSGRDCAATCKAQSGARLLVCTPDVLFRHLPLAQLIRNLAALLHERLVRDNRQRSVDNFMTADQRIDHYLRELTSPAQPRLCVSQSYIATLAGCTRQTVNLRLRQLRENGAIEFGRGEIRIIDRDRLHEVRATQ